MKKITQASGTAVFEDDSKLYFMRQPSLWTATGLFVCMLLAFIFTANAVVQFILAGKPGKTFGALPFAFLAAGLFFALLALSLKRQRNRAARLLPAQLHCICIFDLQNNNLLDANENVIAPLSEVKLKRKMQFTSSSPTLHLQWGKKSMLLVSGNPFSGGIAAIEGILSQRGIRYA